MGGGEVHLSSSNSGSPSLVQIFASAACRLLFITTENAQLIVVTVLKNKCLVAENLLYQIA